MSTAAFTPQAKALNISAAFGFVNDLAKSYPAEEIDAEHKLGTLIHHFRWVLEGLCKSVPGNKATLSNMVAMLNERTLYMHKPFEAATIKSILTGQITMGQGGCGAEARATVTRGLANLVKSGILVKVECHGFPTLYALNIPRLVEHVRAKIASVPSDRAQTRVKSTLSGWAEVEKALPLLERAHARTMALVQSTVENLKHFGAKAAEIVSQAAAVVEEKVEALKEVVPKKVEKAKEVVMNLADSLKQIPNNSQMVAEKRKQKAALPLFDARGKAMSHSGMALWDTLAMDFEHVGYEPRRSGKILGSMKCWLTELAKRGMNEDEIREKMSDIVRRWHHIDPNARLTGVSKNGKPYSVSVDRYPNFGSFYPFRDQYSGLLVAANVPLAAYSKKEMEQVDFNKHKF